jgi:predicted O-methyltransferase YrrM
MTDLSLNSELLRDIFLYAKPYGHNERPDNLNLGFGFLYYGLVRALRPAHTLVIGSGYGFSVVCFALGIKDNGHGHLSFVDPSYSLLKDGPFKTVGGKDMWSQPQKVQEHFRQFGVEEIVTHHKLRNDEFFPAYENLGLPEIDLAFIDGNHQYKDVKYDFLETLKRSRKNTYIFLHDTHLCIREMLRHSGVKRWLKVLKKEEEYFELINFPFSSGVAMVRVCTDKAWEHKE